MTQTALARRVRVLRAQEGISLAEAAERIGVTPETLSDIERGKRHPYTPTLTKIARGYGVPVEDLIEEPVGASSGRAGAPQESGPEQEIKKGPRSLRKFLIASVGHSLFTDQPLEAITRVDDATQTLYDQEYVVFLNKLYTGKYTPEEREHYFDVPASEVVLKYSTIHTAHRRGETIEQISDLIRWDLVRQGFKSDPEHGSEAG